VTSAHARAILAQQRVESAYAALALSAAPVRESFRRHPAAWLLGGGFVAGLAAGLLPVHRWLRTGLYVTTTGIRLLTPFLADVEARSVSSPQE
jgi:hypothetical protein